MNIKKFWTLGILICTGIVLFLYIFAQSMKLGLIKLSPETTQFLQSHSNYTLGLVGAIILFLLTATLELTRKGGPLKE